MNLTDNEIIKALEICLNETDICNGCPYEFDDCLNEDGTSRMTQAAFDLVKRQKAEIERLQYVLMGVMHSVDKWLEGKELKQDEVNRAATMREKTLQTIERLSKENISLQCDLNLAKGELLDTIHNQDVEIERLQNQLKEGIDLSDCAVKIFKAEAIKEFAERLKENVDLYSKYFQEDFPEIVDNLVKEMVGE